MATNTSNPNMQAERKFLHDLATPLGTLTLLLDGAVAYVETSQPPEKVLDKLKKAAEQLERINTLLRDRREVLLKD